jgi:hypothetical protein
MDLLWSCSTLEDVQSLVKALPTKQDRCDALSLVEIATVESLELEQGFNKECRDAAANAIHRAMR